MFKAARILPLIGLLCAVASVAWGQGMYENPTYAGKSNITMDSNLGNCPTTNCWHADGSTTANQISSVGGLTIMGSPSNTKLYLYTEFPTDTWTELTSLESSLAFTWLSTGQIVNSGPAIIAVGPGGFHGGAIYYSVDPFTSWTQLDTNQTFTGVWGAADGEIIAITGASPATGFNAHTAYLWNGSGWTALPTISGKTLLQVVPAGYGKYDVVTSDRLLYQCSKTSCSAFSPNLPSGQLADWIAADANGNLLASGGSTNECTASSCSAYYYLASANAWYQVTPSGNGIGNQQVANGGSLSAWILGTNGAPLRLIDQTLVHTRQLTGTVTCINGNCEGATHDGKVQAQWIVGSDTYNGPVADSGPVYPESEISETSAVYLPDPYTCMGGTSCFIGTVGSVECSFIGATIFTDVIQEGGQMMWTGTKKTRGVVYSSGNEDYQQYVYVNNYCATGHNPPDASYGATSKDVGNIPHGPYPVPTVPPPGPQVQWIDTHAGCWTNGNQGNHQPFLCGPVNVSGNYNVSAPEGLCDYNP